MTKLYSSFPTLGHCDSLYFKNTFENKILRQITVLSVQYVEVNCYFAVSQGMLLAQDIRDRERGGRAEIRVVEGEAESSSPQAMELMTETLGERTVALKDGPPDEAVDQEQKGQLTLYQWEAHRQLIPYLC